MEIIKLEHGEISRLAKVFKVSLPTVRKALRGETGSGLAKVLRAAALERGGVALQSKSSRATATPETEFRTSEKQMIQTFGERVRIVIDLKTGEANLYADGELQSTYHNLTMKELDGVQIEAQRIADKLDFNIETE